MRFAKLEMLHYTTLHYGMALQVNITSYVDIKAYD